MPATCSQTQLKVFEPADLDKYLQEDVLLKQMESCAQAGDRDFVSHRWLLDSEPKRMIFQHVYGDLLEPGAPKSILDVGGGYTSLSRPLLHHHEYRLLDIMAHDSADDLYKVEEQVGQRFWLNDDWYNFQPDGPFDIVIANDIFPNVDQRIEMFLDKYLPCCRELRVTLTYYNNPRFYPTKRLDGDEVLYFLAWSGSQLGLALKRFVEGCDLEVLETSSVSLFPNGRSVAYLKLAGHA